MISCDGTADDGGKKKGNPKAQVPNTGAWGTLRGVRIGGKI